MRLGRGGDKRIMVACQRCYHEEMTVDGEVVMGWDGYQVPCRSLVWECLVQVREEDPSAVARGLGSVTLSLHGHLTTTVPSLPTTGTLLGEDTVTKNYIHEENSSY